MINRQAHHCAHGLNATIFFQVAIELHLMYSTRPTPGELGAFVKRTKAGAARKQPPKQPIARPARNLPHELTNLDSSWGIANDIPCHIQKKAMIIYSMTIYHRIPSCCTARHIRIAEMIPSIMQLVAVMRLKRQRAQVPTNCLSAAP